MRKLLLLVALILTLGVTTALAGTRVKAPDDEAARIAADIKKKYGHPKPRLIANSDVKLEVIADKIIRSCCKPPDLMVRGNIVNSSAKPIDYVRLELIFKNNSGQVVHTEDAYNHQAVSLGEDEETRKALCDARHFDPLPPGARDTFYFYIPMPLIPRYSSVDLRASEVVRLSQVAQLP
jgi:hypothetical protein